MKVTTVKEFYHTPALPKALKAGQSLLVTSNGSPHFLVTKPGFPRRKTGEEIRAENAVIFGPRPPKTNVAQLLEDLRG